MKKLLMCVFGVLLSVALGATAWAYPSFQVNADNAILFTNIEQWVDASPNGFIDVGDSFYGILAVQDVKVGSSFIWSHSDTTAPYDSFTGYFLTSVTAVAFPGGGAPIITLGPYAGGSDPKGVITDPEIASGVLMKLYTDTVTPYNGALDAGIASATDGSLWASFGLAGSGYWYTVAPVSPPASGFVGTSYLGLNLITDNTGLPLVSVNDPVEGVINTNVAMYAKSYIFTSESGVPGQFDSNDPGVIHPIVPEPGSMLLLSMGLAGLAVIRRKKAA